MLALLAVIRLLVASSITATAQEGTPAAAETPTATVTETATATETATDTETATTAAIPSLTCRAASQPPCELAPDQPVTNAQLSLLVFKDGEEVERFPLSQALSLQAGDTDVTTRYIPLEGWSPGQWTFELLLETVEGSGAAVVVASQPIEGGITIPQDP